MISGSLCPSFVSVGVEKGERGALSERDWVCVVAYGGIG